ncbi:MAG TPA: hypothetical protein VGW75_09690 [Solirubrobacteraceae bacterium]|nr:hypothetical protein [Solirubrobacteraceae bacterium]
MLRLVPMLAVVAVTLAGSLAPGGAAVRGGATSASARAAVDPAVAPEAMFPAGGPSAAAAWEVATSHWAAAPCGGKVELSWTRLAAGVNATASWWNPTDPWSNPRANYDCRVEFNVDMDFDWPKFCTVLAHEVGHLLGRQHTSGDLLMDPTYSRPLPACEQTADPAAPAPVADEEDVEDEVVAAPAASSSRVAGARWAGPGAGSAKAAAAARGPRCLSGRASNRRVRRFACVRAAGGARRGWQAQ